MATDATGTPSPLGIPKYNTAVDNPSGKGLNAIVDSLDTIITQAPRSGAIAGIAVGSVPVWNGTAWVKPTGTPDGTKFLRDDGVWAGALSTYVPVWSSTGGTQPVLNNGTITGRFLQIGKPVFFQITLTIGSTTTFGVAAWRFTLPVPAAAGGPAGVVGTRLVDISVSAIYLQQAYVDSTNGAVPVTLASPALYYDGSTPFLWATGDTLDISGFYAGA